MPSIQDDIQALFYLDPVFVDTETTGLKETAEICEIAVVGSDGQVLFESLVKPTHPIPADAQRIHGISNKDVADAPTIVHIWPRIEELLFNKIIICYNADYDSRLIRQSLNAHGYGQTRLTRNQWYCAMLMYSAYLRQEKWVKLVDALAYERVRVPGTAHRAAYDARCTHALMSHIANTDDHAYIPDEEDCPF